MNMHVPSLEPGASSLPAELRIRRGDNETVYGHDRLVMGQRFPHMGHMGFVHPGLPRGWGAGAGESLHGIGDIGDTLMYDATNDEYYTVPDSSGPALDPYQSVTAPTMIQNNPAAPNYGQLVLQSTGALANILAVSQGGSVQAGPHGTIVQGSPQGAVTQAAAGGGVLNVGAGGVQAALGTSGIYIAGALVVGLLFLMSQRGR